MSKKGNFIKKLGLEPTTKRTPTVLRKRIRTLKKNLKDGKYRGKLKTRAQYYLNEHISKLEEAS